MTTFGDQVYQFGGAPLGLPYSWLKGPRGRVLFVAPTRSSGTFRHGASDSNPGTLDAPLLTIARALELCTGNLGEIIYLIGTSDTAADVSNDLTATLTWSKNFVHLIGLVPPVAVSQRARITNASGADPISPLIDVTAHGCVFANFQLFHGQDDATALIALRQKGNRNYYENLHLAGIGHATMSAAGAADLVCDGGTETTFKNCVIGLDTITRDGDPRNVIFDSGASRYTFEDCFFPAFISAAGYASVKVADSTGIDRWIRFKRCRFLTESVNDGTQQTSVFDIPAMTQGYILLEDSYAGTAGGTAEWDSNNRGRIYNNAVEAAASAAGGIFTRQ